ncbi:MAG: Melibiase [Lentisphaerae bacterium ADurb.Bin242]|nr:MAG: Melibiase [Lentisphaerae bacterium ADurb.Bin242]
MKLRKETACYRAYLPLDLPPEADFAYRNNNNMVAHLQGSNVFPARVFNGDYPSQDMLVIGDIYSKRFMLIGALTAFRSLTYLTLHRRGKFTGVTVEQPHIKPDETPEEILVLEGDSWQDLMIQYADAAAKKMSVPRIQAARNFTAYCTWYYYYAGVSESNLLENVAALTTNRSRYAAEYVQIDDGYQPFQGDWLEQRHDWPTPLRDIVAKIGDGGMKPGIWTIPLMASTVSRVFREHQDWFVRDGTNQPALIRGWSAPPDTHWGCLDATRPEVLDHLVNVFNTFRSYGFAYFKMDGLGLGLMEGIRQDSAATPVSAYRQALKAIRETVPDAVLLGCGAPFMPTLGLVDHCRVSYDTSRYYENPRPEPANGDDLFRADIKTAIHVLMSHWWKFDRWFRADPDALMARQDNAYYSYGEAKMSILTGILTGVCTTSDNFNTIDANRLALLERAVKYRIRNAHPFSWTTGCWPQVFIGNFDDGRKAVAIFNDSNQIMTYHFQEYGLPEQCEELLDAPSIRKFKIVLPPHDAALLAEVGKSE